MVTPECSLQALGHSCSQDEFSWGQCKEPHLFLHPTACSSCCLPWEHPHLLPPRMLGSKAVFPPPLSGVGRAAASSEHTSLCSAATAAFGQPVVTHTSTWNLEYPFTVKSVRYWIYMVSAEHIRRSSASPCLFETAIIIQAVTLSHRCFWKTIQY